MNKEPEFKTRHAFKIIGIERYTKDGIPSIREAWAEYSKRKSEIPNAVGPIAFGLEDYSRDLDMNNGGFPKYYYTAALEVSDLTNIPTGMTGRVIEKASYGVFTYTGPMEEIHDFFNYIYHTWLPNSGYKIDPRLNLDFERYPEEIMDMNRALVEIWLPIVK